jgi:serine/threonine protein kinase
MGVSALHKKNILHRDIKLENILVTDLTEDTGVRIGDMGSAIQLDSAAGTTDFMIGTPGYIAPEMLRGEGYGLAYDVWAIGALMHALLTMELPFWAQDSKQRR